MGRNISHSTRLLKAQLQLGPERSQGWRICFPNKLGNPWNAYTMQAPAEPFQRALPLSGFLHGTNHTCHLSLEPSALVYKVSAHLLNLEQLLW